MVHDRHLVAEAGDDADVVGDEEIGDAGLLLQAAQQSEGLGLDQHIQAADRLVEDHQPRFQRQGAGDADPLQLTAAELVRVLAGVARLEPDHCQQEVDLLAKLAVRQVFEITQRFGEDILDRPPGVDRAQRVLEHHLHFAAELPPVVCG